MIDKITPRPDTKVQKMLEEDGFEDNYTIITDRHTYTAPFVNAEETEYLVIEDQYTNGRPPLEQGGGCTPTGRRGRGGGQGGEDEGVHLSEPLHTAMSIYGCLLDYSLISAEMKDEDLCGLITKMGYIEAMPVVVDPGVLKPADFIGAVLNKRLPNPFMPDAPSASPPTPPRSCPSASARPSRPIRPRAWIWTSWSSSPGVLANYARYLKGVNDAGQPFEPSPDPLAGGRPRPSWPPWRSGRAPRT